MNQLYTVQIKVKKLHPDAKLPTKATEGSACYDIYSSEDVMLFGGIVIAVPTGLALETPLGYSCEIRPRSGLASQGILLANSPGTLDSDYRGELKILLLNLSLSGETVLKKGNRVAQMKLVREEETEFVEVENLSKTERGEGGFGSTGR